MNTNVNSKTKLGLWLSTFISIIGLLLIVLIAFIIEKTIEPNLNRTMLTIVSVIIAIIPPILWLSIFYRQDRLNPEPKSFVFKTLLLGALVQKALYAPIISLVFPGSNGGIATAARDYVASIILVALIQESTKLLSVRYSIYPSNEFDEKIDGIIYGSALGLGFAMMTSIDSIIVTGGAALTNVTSLVVIETFAQASITGLSCYILGVSKQKKFNFWRLPAAVLIASALNAVTRVLLDAVTRNGFKVNYILGLIPAALVAIAVFSVLVYISSRNEKEGAKAQVQILDQKKALVGIIPVWVILVLALVVGFTVSHVSTKTAQVWVDNSINLQYPSKWIQYKNGGELFKAANMLKGGGQEFVSVQKIPLKNLLTVETKSEEETLQNIAAAWSIKSGMSYRFYQSEKGYFLNSNGKETYVIDYIYIANDQTKLGDSTKPAMGFARDVISVAGDQVYIVTLSSGYDEYVLNNNVLNEMSYTFKK
ncbi:MAG: PrsW family glutamic-type intramembrane protease [Clostridia bacterium]|nr:PrsW family glutamic-type intramembrane protease [Clostridia bacterium]